MFIIVITTQLLLKLNENIMCMKFMDICFKCKCSGIQPWRFKIETLYTTKIAGLITSIAYYNDKKVKYASMSKSGHSHSFLDTLVLLGLFRFIEVSALAII